MFCFFNINLIFQQHYAIAQQVSVAIKYAPQIARREQLGEKIGLYSIVDQYEPRTQNQRPHLLSMIRSIESKSRD